MARPPAAGGVSLTEGDLPVGRLVAIHRGSTGAEIRGPLHVEPGGPGEALTVVGVPIEALSAWTRLRVGDAAVVELAGDAESPGDGERLGALRVGLDGPRVPIRVIAAGTIHVGAPVTIEAVRVPIEGALDLHSFRPDEIAEVVREYLGAASAAGLGEVRLIHGRGRGVQRETVRRTLAASPVVAAFADAPAERGGWGATIVRLRAARPSP